MPRYLFYALAFGKKKILPMFPLGNMRAAGPLIARIIPDQEHLFYHRCLQAQYRAVVLSLADWQLWRALKLVRRFGSLCCV